MVDRRIDNVYRLILNGYCGSLFNFMYVGNIVWVTPALGLFFFFQIKKQKGEIPAVFLVFFVVLFLSLLIIGAKGYFNERYQLSILPVLICIVWILLHRLQGDGKSTIIVIFLCAAFFNFTYYFFGFFVNKYVNNLSSQTRESIKSESSIQVKDCIEELLKNQQLYTEKILVAAVPEFYYYTNMKAVYYYPSTDQVFTKSGILSLKEWLKNNSIQRSKTYSYIIVNDAIVHLSLSFSNYLRSNTSLMFKDAKGKSVYRLIAAK